MKRRVYDALNVLIAANVLKKVNKNVYYNESGFFNSLMTSKKEMSSAQEIKHKRENIIKELERKENENYQKKVHLKDLLNKLFAVKELMKKNKAQNRQRFVSFPFMLVAPCSVNDSHVFFFFLNKQDCFGDGAKS